MKKIITISILSIIITACDNSNSEYENIEGTWKSTCIQLPDLSVFDGTTTNAIYFNTTYEYKNNIVINTFNSFSDSDCQSEEPVDLSNLFADESNITAYLVGNKIITQNGVQAFEITLSLKNGNVIDDIFSIINNGNSLLFGKRTSQEYFSCFFSSNILPASQGTLGGSTQECTRPTELNYERLLTKVNN